MTTLNIHTINIPDGTVWADVYDGDGRLLTCHRYTAGGAAQTAAAIASSAAAMYGAKYQSMRLTATSIKGDRATYTYEPHNSDCLMTADHDGTCIVPDDLTD